MATETPPLACTMADAELLETEILVEKPKRFVRERRGVTR